MLAAILDNTCLNKQRGQQAKLQLRSQVSLANISRTRVAFFTSIRDFIYLRCLMAPMIASRLQPKAAPIAKLNCEVNNPVAKPARRTGFSFIGLSSQSFNFLNIHYLSFSAPTYRERGFLAIL